MLLEFVTNGSVNSSGKSSSIAKTPIQNLVYELKHKKKKAEVLFSLYLHS